ncbi:MAG: iron ABC transporter permease [Cohaesibacter sp.]|nr:iron ABC transporter permease [Cohaesibacter sp.]
MSKLIYRSKYGTISFSLERAVPLALVFLLVCLFVLFVLSLALGSYDLSLSHLWQALFAAPEGETSTTILWDLRLPRFLASLLVGMMLGLSGAILQGVTRNPLADPSLVGVSQGASLAVVALIVLWPSAPLHLRPIIGFAGALLAASLVQWIAAGKSSSASLRFILVGVGISATISACTNAILTYGQINHAAAALSWLAGSVHTASWGECLVLMFGLAVLSPCLVWAVRPLSGLRFGPELATGLGLHLKRDRSLLIALAVALAALAVSMTGPLGFIGLIAAQLVHRLLRVGTGSHLLLSALVGGVLVALADLVGRTALAPIQLPAGLISAAIGAPIFIALIFRNAGPKHL